MSHISPDMQDEARIAEELVLNPDWQRDTDQIEIVKGQLQQVLKDRQSDQSWIQDLESRLLQKNSQIEECEAAQTRMGKQIKKINQVKWLQEGCEERERGLEAQKSELEQVKSFMGWLN